MKPVLAKLGFEYKVATPKEFAEFVAAEVAQMAAAAACRRPQAGVARDARAS